MNWKQILGILILTGGCFLRPAFAGQIEELQQQLIQLKAEYENKIQELETKVNTLIAAQDEKVAALEKKVEEKTIDVDYVGRGNAPVGRGGVVVENPFGFGTVSLGGYFDMEYHDFANTDSTFRQHRWIINIGAQLAERLRFNSEFEIEYGGSEAVAGDGEARVEQAYADFLINDMINLRAGAILVPFGRYNLYHDSDLQDLTDRPLVARDVIPTTWTEAGYGFFGEFNPIFGSYEDLSLKYELYAVNGLDAGFSDTGLSGARSSLKTDNNEGKSVIGRLVASPWLGQELGVSRYWGEYNTAGDAMAGSGVDTLMTFGPFEFVTEYAYFDVEESPTLTSDVTNFFQGAYAQLNYHFWPKILNDTFLGRGFKDATFTLVGRYDWAFIGDDSDAGNLNNEEERYTLGFNYRPLDSFVFKFEYQWNDTSNEPLERGKDDGFVTSVAMGF